MIGIQSLYRLFAVTGLGVLLATCADPGAPTSASSGPPAGIDLLTSSSTLAQSAGGLPDWVVNPSTLPPGEVGKNSCTFAFGQNVPQWDFHPDAGCWERPGPDGWTRQQQHLIHVPQLAACGGGAGDVSPIRVCRAGGAGQPAPCGEIPTTGPTGCTICVREVACH